MGNSIDIILLVVMAYGFYQGYNRGIISTLFTITGYVLGVVLAFKLIPFTGSLLRDLTGKDNPLMAIAAFVANLSLIMLVLRMLARGAEGVLQVFFLGAVNRILGGLLMSLIAALIFSVLLWFGIRANLVSEDALAGSRTYDSFLARLPARAKGAFVWARPHLSEAWQESMNWMNRVEDFGEKRDPNQPRIYELPDDGAEFEGAPESSSSASRRRALTGDDGIEE